MKYKNVKMYKGYIIKTTPTGTTYVCKRASDTSASFEEGKRLIGCKLSKGQIKKAVNDIETKKLKSLYQSVSKV